MKLHHIMIDQKPRVPRYSDLEKELQRCNAKKEGVFSRAAFYFSPNRGISVSSFNILI
jgi:hypothetical protein